MTRTDSEIQQDVLRELKWDTRVAETEVGVQVKNGVVALTGTVGSWGKRLAAQEAAHRVRGVLDVANDLEVTLPSRLARTDSELAAAVRHALEWDVFVPDERIRTTVSDGQVTLEGSVDAWAEREDAEQAVRNLAGVTGVVNRLTLAPTALLLGDVTHAIEAALERRAEREAKHIEVTTENGVVRLSGRVRSWPEHQAVVGAARYTPGVTAVDDRLVIDASM